MVSPMSRTEPKPAFGEEVTFSVGLAEVRGPVHEVYGPPAGGTSSSSSPPEVSGEMFDEPTMVSLPLADVKRVAPTAWSRRAPTTAVVPLHAARSRPLPARCRLVR
jgi:hypothetical protein